MCIFVLFLILEEVLSIYLIEYNVSCGFTIYGLFYVELCFFSAQSVKGIYHERIFYFVKYFSAYVEIIIWFLFFILLMQYITFIDLCMLNHPCIPEINPTWPCCITLLMYSWTQFANILLKFFASKFIRDIGLYFSFGIFSRFCYQSNAEFLEWA